MRETRTGRAERTRRAAARRRKALVITLCVCLAMIALTAVLIAHYFFPSRGDQPVKVTIEEGDSAAAIAEKLHRERIITSATIFRALAWLQGKQGKFKPGRYTFYTGMRFGEVFDMLEAGPQHQVRLTIPEGLTVSQTAERVAGAMDVSAEDFLCAAAEGGYDLPLLPPQNAGNLEGFLFPKTYDLPADARAREVIETLLNQFKVETSGLDWDRAGELGLNPYQVLIVASLIEREVVLDAERPLVAAVIYNRLRKDMLLQIDATVQYALPEWKEVLTYEDLKVQSPYNTYLHKGLPPAPICSPGLASIMAALEPAEVDYLFYVATGDGGHFFTADYDEFLRVKEEVQGD
ncbi:MAG: endolytic transglycosylase MltG [Actinobacteria bacterium]|nr:endolytic transglycosylase MltG [Actinomycetota bacterium]